MTKKLAQALTDAKREGWSEWIESAADEHAVMEGCFFDFSAGKYWCDLMEMCLVHTMAPWTGPFRLLGWQRNEIVMPLFGWKKDKSRPTLRRYSKGDVFIAKKQGKSTLFAGIANCFLLKGGDRTEIYGVAHVREQAGIIYREAASMVSNSPELAKRLVSIDSRKRIVYQATASFYQVLAGENGAKGAEGINPLLILLDEIHTYRSRELYDALAYASIARENGLMLSGSTVGVADKTTIWWEQYEYAKGIIAGTIFDPARFAYIAQADEGCIKSKEMRADPTQWRKAMPSLGHTVQEEAIAEKVREAENSPAKLNNLLRYLFNIPTAQVDHVIPMDKWEACRWTDDEFPDMLGRRCIAGLDMASSEDIAALVLYFPPIGDEERGYLKCYFWCPEEKIRQRELNQMAFYGDWVRKGHLRETPGARIDHDTILMFAREVCDLYQVEEMPYDKWNADAVVNPLELDGVKVVSIEQGFDGMSANCQQFLDAIINEELWHDGNEVMAWCCGNVAADTKHDDLIRFNKEKSAGKIDGAVAGAMAVGRGRLQPVAAGSSYDEPGNLAL